MTGQTFIDKVFVHAVATDGYVEVRARISFVEVREEFSAGACDFAGFDLFSELSNGGIAMRKSSVTKHNFDAATDQMPILYRSKLKMKSNSRKTRGISTSKIKNAVSKQKGPSRGLIPGPPAP